MEGSGVSKPVSTRRTSRFSDPVPDKGPPADELKKAAEAIKQEYKSLIQHLTHLHGIGTSYTDDRTLSMFAPNMQLPPELRGLKEQEKERKERLKELRDELRKRKETEPVGLADWFESDSGSFLEGRAAKVAKQDLEGKGEEEEGKLEEEGQCDREFVEGDGVQADEAEAVGWDLKLGLQGAPEEEIMLQSVNNGAGSSGKANGKKDHEPMGEDPVMADRKVAEKETGGRGYERRSRRGDNHQTLRKEERRQRERDKGKDREKDRRKTSDKSSGPRRKHRDHQSYQEEHKSSRSQKRKHSRSKDIETARVGCKKNHNSKSDQQKVCPVSGKEGDDSQNIPKLKCEDVTQEVKKKPDDAPDANVKENPPMHTEEVVSRADGESTKDDNVEQVMEVNEDTGDGPEASINCCDTPESASSKMRELNNLDRVVADGQLLKWYQDVHDTLEVIGPSDCPVQDEKLAPTLPSCKKDNDTRTAGGESLDNAAEIAMRSARAQLISWLRANDPSFVCPPSPFQSNENAGNKKVEEVKAKVVIKRNSFFPVPRQKPKEENPDFTIVKPTAVPKIIFNENGSAESVRPEDGEKASGAETSAPLQSLVSGTSIRGESSAVATVPTSSGVQQILISRIVLDIRCGYCLTINSIGFIVSNLFSIAMHWL